MDNTDNNLDNFLSYGNGVLYVMVNMTRKTVGVGTCFGKRKKEDGTLLAYDLSCPNVTREHKLTGDLSIVPSLLTDTYIQDNQVMRVKQLRYIGSQKSDTIVVFKFPCSNANLILA